MNSPYTRERARPAPPPPDAFGSSTLRVLANSVQKSGTHLLFKLLEELGIPRYRDWRLDPEWTLERSAWRRVRMTPPGTRRTVSLGQGVAVSARFVERLLRAMPEDHAILGHCAHSPDLASLVAASGARTVAIMRDPRDVAVSHAHFLMKIGKDKITSKPAHRALVGLPDHGARLLAMLRGHPGTASVGDRYRQFLGWLDEPDVLVVRFEDLVGEAGAGCAERQRVAIETIAEHVGRTAELAHIDDIRGRLFGDTATFRRGTSGQWREEFAPEHHAAAQEELAELLITLGYESDTDW